jgi:hypothetical protein
VKPNELKKITSPKDAALNLIRPYIERGDNPEHLRTSYLGSLSDSYHASIGGYIDGKQYNSNYIVVNKVNGVVVNKVFKYQDIVDELQSKQLSLV